MKSQLRALGLTADSVARSRRVLGKDDIQTLGMAANLAINLRLNCDPRGALELGRRVVPERDQAQVKRARKRESWNFPPADTHKHVA